MNRSLQVVAALAALVVAGCSDHSTEPSIAKSADPSSTSPLAAEGPDFDGDGTTDILVIDQRDDGAWVGEVAWGSGTSESVDLQLPDPVTIGPLWPAGWADVDGDGIDEAFAVVFAGADHVRLGMFTVVDGRLTRVVDDTGAPAELHVSAGYTFTTAFDCPGDRTILVHEYVRDPEVRRHSTTTLRLEGTTLTDGGTADAEPLPLDAEIPPFTCGQVAPFGTIDE